MSASEKRGTISLAGSRSSRKWNEARTARSGSACASSGTPSTSGGAVTVWEVSTPPSRTCTSNVCGPMAPLVFVAYRIGLGTIVLALAGGAIE